MLNCSMVASFRNEINHIYKEIVVENLEEHETGILFKDKYSVLCLLKSASRQVANPITILYE